MSGERRRARNEYRCRKCGHTTTAYAAMERHLDAEHDGHGRIDRYDALALARDDGWDTGHDDRLHGRPFDEDAAAIGGPGSTPQSDAWAEGYREGYAEPI